MFERSEYCGIVFKERIAINTGISPSLSNPNPKHTSFGELQVGSIDEHREGKAGHTFSEAEVVVIINPSHITKTT